jgi:hypothetical protein
MNPASPGRLRDVLTAAALFVATAAFTLWQNTRVAALWDLSYLLDSSYRFSLGQMPYRDFPFVHPPLHYLLHAAIIRIFGLTYYPHILCAALEAGLATVLTWRILLHLLRVPHDHRAEGEVIVGTVTSTRPERQNDRARAWLLATLLAIPLVFLGIYGVYPHPIYDSDTTLAVLFALYLLQRTDSLEPMTASRARNFIAGAACVLPLFIKQNIGLPFLAITLLAVAAVATLRRLNSLSIAPQRWIFTGAATMLAAAALAIHVTGGLHNYLYWTITFAAQRRLPGLSLLLETYGQGALLWTLPAALAGLALVRRQGPGAQSMAQSHRDMGGMRYRLVAFILLAAPFLWTIASLALTTDPDDRSDQLLSLWPHLLLLAALLTLYNLRPRNLRSNPNLNSLLPLVLLATIEGTFLSQQLWGSTYAIWPLMMILIAALLAQIRTLARPLAAVIAATLLLCGGLYATSHERLNYIHLDGPLTHATLPQLRGLATPGPWIPDFEELVRYTNSEIPANDGILLLPGEVPFYFATGRTPQFPVLLFDPATNPYTPRQVLDQARAHNIRWLIVTRNLQIATVAEPDLPEVIRTLQRDFVPYRTLTNYDIYRRK